MFSETIIPAAETAEVPEPQAVEKAESFGSIEIPENQIIVKLTRATLIALGIIVVPGAIPVAAVGGAYWLVNKIRSSRKAVQSTTEVV